MTAVATLLCACAAVGAGGAARSAPTGDDTDRPGARSAFRIGAGDGDRAVLHLRGAVTGRTVPDTSGAGNPGRLIGGRGGWVVSTRSGAHGRYLRFTGSGCKRRTACPWAVVAVRAGDDVENPGPKGEPAFTYGAWVRLTGSPGRAGMTVIRRGPASGGEPHWSLTVDDGRVSCRWSDGDRTAVLPDDVGRSVALQQRRWYAVSCARHGAHFGLTVTDPLSGWLLGSHTAVDDTVGTDRPRGPITVGAAADGPVRNDSGRVSSPFHGDLDEVMVRSG
jgi:hypothetical protein